MYRLRTLSLILGRRANLDYHLGAMGSSQQAFNGLFGTTGGYRTYMRRKTIKKPPSKPLNFDYGGDIVKTLQPLTLDQPKPGFENIKELEEAEGALKKIFSLEFGDARDALQKQVADLTEKVKNHPADLKSLEYLITLQTVLIRNQMKHCLEFRKDKVSKAQLVVRIQSRKKKMKELREKDYDKFIWLLQELKIKYVPVEPYSWVKLGKRAQRQQKARIAALDLYTEKKEALREKIDHERQSFEEIKMQELAQIEQELAELGIEPQDTLEETINMLKYGVPKMKAEPYKTRRQMLLEKKFKMKEAKKKEQEEINYQKALYNM